MFEVECRGNPAGFVSYGGVSDGTRAVQTARQVVRALKKLSMSEAVSNPFVQQLLSEEG